MGSGRVTAAIVLVAALALAIPLHVSGETTHVYAVSLTIAANPATGKIDGTIVTEAPSEFCDSSTIRVREAMRGKDRVIARIPPYGGEWHLKPPPALSGKRIYAEVSKYHLPSRPVICLEARSPAIRVP
jgi:hypothetical protein